MQSIKSNIATVDEPLFRSSVPTTGYIFKSGSDNTIAASVLFQDGAGRIGINTISPGFNFELSGNWYLHESAINFFYSGSNPKWQHSPNNYIELNTSSGGVTTVSGTIGVSLITNSNSAFSITNLKTRLAENTFLQFSTTTNITCGAWDTQNSKLLIGELGVRAILPTIDAAFQIRHASVDQLKIEYDTTHFWKAVTDSSGLTTMTAAGTAAGSYGFSFEGTFGISHINGSIQGTSSVDDTGIEYNWTNGTNGGSFQLNATQSKFAHTLAISLDAPAIGMYGITPIARPTTAYASATFVVVGGASVNINDTFDGYTIGQVIKILRNRGDLT